MERKKFDYAEAEMIIGINKDDPSDAMAYNSSWIFYYGHQQAVWDNTVANLERRLETTEAEVGIEIRAAATVKMTVEGVKAEIANNANVKKLKEGLEVANEQARLYKNIVVALHAQTKNLSNLAFSRSAEQRASTTAGFQEEDEPRAKYTREQRAELAKRLANS